MAPWSLKTVAKRLMGEEEQRVVPVNERRKRTSQTNLLETMGPEAPADLLRKLRGQKLSQKVLDEKLLEVIIKLDALGARGDDVGSKPPPGCEYSPYGIAARGSTSIPSSSSSKSFRAS